MAFVIARKQPGADIRAPKIWLYWTGSDWDKDVTKASRFADRAAAIVKHGELVKAHNWAEGTNPLVVERG